MFSPEGLEDSPFKTNKRKSRWFDLLIVLTFEVEFWQSSLMNSHFHEKSKSSLSKIRHVPVKKSSVFTKIKPSKFAGFVFWVFDHKNLPSNFQVSKLRIQTKICPFIHSFIHCLPLLLLMKFRKFCQMIWLILPQISAKNCGINF